jgi:hypothetical protein
MPTALHRNASRFFAVITSIITLERSQHLGPG